MSTKTLVVILALIAQTNVQQAERTTPPAVEEHIREIVKGLPDDSDFRRILLQGARGKGIRYPWMDKMRELGVKRAVVWFDIRFNRKGQPKEITLNRTEYFTQYEGGAAISDEKQLNAIRMSGLEKDVKPFGEDRARHGFWIVDVPRPRPHPFIGGTSVEVFDDEWLPGPSSSRYYAGHPN
jgi:hypothetical protein